MLVHVVAIALIVFRSQTGIFVEVPAADLRKIDFASLVEFGKFRINIFHGCAGGKTEFEFRLGVDCIGNHAGGKFFRIGGSFADDDIHNFHLIGC